MLKALGAEGKALIVTAESDKTVVKSAANIPGVKTATVNNSQCLRHSELLISLSFLQRL